MNKTVKYTLFMIVLGVIISFALALVNEITSPIIEQQKLEKVKNLRQHVLGGRDLYMWIAGSFYVCFNFVWEGSNTCYSESLN